MDAVATIDYLARARALAPMLEAAADDIERLGELPEPVRDTLIERGFFRMLQPRSLGGAELRPSVFSRVTEQIARADGSTAWVLCQGSGCSMSAAYLAPGPAREIFGPADGHPGLGAADRAAGSGGARGVSGKRHLALCQRQPSCDLARGACLDPGGGRLAAAERQGRTGDTDHAVSEIGNPAGEHLERAGPARHGQRPVHHQGPVRSGGPFAVARRSGRAGGAGAAVSFHQRAAVRVRVCRGGAGAGTRGAGCVRGARQAEEAARRHPGAAGEPCDPVAVRPGRGEVAVLARAAAPDAGCGLGACGAARGDDPGPPDGDTAGVHLGDPAIQAGDPGHL